jgi:hypothetical protein
VTEPVGSAAEEAAKLLGAVADWARDHGGELGGAVSGLAAQASTGLGAAAHDLDAHLANGEDCRFCPICRGIQAVRTSSPAVREPLSAAVASLAQALSAALATTVPDTRRSGVERIDLTDEWPDDRPDDLPDGPGEDG